MWIGVGGLGGQVSGGRRQRQWGIRDSMVTLVPIRAQMEGFGSSAIGLMGSAYFVGFVIGCIVGPKVVQAVGHTRAFAGFAALVAALTLIFPMVVDPVSYTHLRAHYTGRNLLCRPLL